MAELKLDIIINFYANSIVYFGFTWFFIKSAMVFENRSRAGVQLTGELVEFLKDTKAVVLGLPRGGVVVAEAVAKFLHLPLDVILLLKLPHPPQPELAVGAVAEHGAVFVNAEFQDAVREDPSWLENRPGTAENHPERCNPLSTPPSCPGSERQNRDSGR